MSDEQSTIEPAAGANGPEHAVGTGDTAVQTTGEIAYDPAAEDDQGWDEPVEDLPRRPRRRLLGVGGNPIALALLSVLLIACGFIGGVLVEKGQSTSSSSAGTAGTGLASRFAALRGGGVGGGGSSGGGAGATGATTGQVAYLSGSTLYVSTTEGNTVKVTTSPASTITKTVKAEVKGIHPGETVLVTGTAGKNGTISAESIRVGAGGAGGGGLGALFGGSGAGGGGRGGTGGSSSSTGGEPALFGKGG